jgi:hypothetical protein
VCALVASVVCYQLVERHVTGLSGPAWFELGCSDKPGGAAAGCAEVLASPYSYFPGLPHIPVAFIGLMYYSTLLAWLVGHWHCVREPSESAQGVETISIGFVESTVNQVVSKRFYLIPQIQHRRRYPDPQPNLGAEKFPARFKVHWPCGNLSLMKVRAPQGL